MPTNTTTPEAATTTTPATTTTSTTLSAMTGEEVASILVGLIRQNDGILIQQKVTDGINQSPAGAELSQGKAAIVAALQSVGITATTNDTLTVLAAKMLQAIAIINTATFTENRPRTVGELLLQNTITEIVDSTIETVSVPYPLLQNYPIKHIKMPNLVSGALFYKPSYTTYNVTSVEYIECEKRGDNFMNLFSLMPNYQLTLPNFRHIKGFGSFNGTSWFATPPQLYDNRPFSTIVNNANYSGWNPTEALNASTASLCTKDEWDDPNEPQGGFANNLQKFLWYFEYHFIPCFGDVSSLPLADRPVLTLYTTVESAINSAMSKSQPTKTLKQLLVDDKGWQVLASN